jgi:HD-GYP domain-containing protein (c-di-GMP phosphodiesterase class II)
VSERDEDPRVEDAAPACPHDELEPYWTDSPLAESFAPGILAEADLGALQLADETPWRGHAGHTPDRSKLGRRVPEPGSPEAQTEAQRARLEAAEATARAREAMAQAVASQRRRDDARQGIATESADAEAADVDLGVVRVLVVHPNANTRRQVARALGALGFETTTCADTERAAQRAVQERPDAMVVELGSDGIDALALCRAVGDRAAGLPVLIVAAGEDEAHYSVAMEAGAADYLRQPLTPAAMGERLRIAVRKARAARPQPAPETLSNDPEMADRRLRRQQLKIQSLFELSRNVVGCLELDELYHGFLLTAMGQLGLGAGILYHLDSGRGGRVVEVVSRGIPRAEAETLLDFRTALGMFLLRSPHPVLLEPDCCPPELRGEVDRLRRSGLAVACPMASKGAAVGVALFGGRVSGQSFDADDLLMLSAVCNFAGPALDSARLFTELQLTYLSTVRAFVSSLEAKDAYTRGHSERVADYSRALAQSCGFKRRELDMIVFGGMLHDIGKIGVSEGILNKPAPLTPEEWRVVRGHPEMGARIVSHIDYLAAAVPMILHHHERIDGRGYPHGLTGDDIELGARIVTVADSFDAMTTHRPYRRAMDVAQAAKLLRAHSGRQFDAQIVETFLGLLEAGTVKPPSS